MPPCILDERIRYDYGQRFELCENEKTFGLSKYRLPTLTDGISKHANRK
jgi:hypothetical protein